MADAPRALVGHAKLTLKFLGRHLVTGSRHEVHGVEPQGKLGGGVLTDRPRAGVSVAALLAGVTAHDLGQLSHHPALGAGAAFP